MKIITKNVALSCFIFLINSQNLLGMGAAQPTPDNTMAPGMGAPTPAAPDNTMAPGMGAPVPDQSLPAPQPAIQVDATQIAPGMGAPAPAPDNTMAPGMGAPVPDQSLQMPALAQAAPGMGVPAPAAPGAPGINQSQQIPAPQTGVIQGAVGVPQAVPPVVAEVLSGPDIVQLSEDKIALVKTNNPKITKTFDDGEKLGKDRAALLKSMTDASQALKDKVTDQETKIADFYQSFEFKEGQTEELLTPLFATLKKEEKK